LLLALLLPLAGCDRERGLADHGALRKDELAGTPEAGAVSTAPVKTNETRATPDLPPLPPPRSRVDWSPLTLEHSRASVSCSLDYRNKEADGWGLIDLSRDGLREALTPCTARSVVRIRFAGKIDGDFTSLVERVSVIADDLGIVKRVLDVDSAGGMVEDAIRAGDFMAESRWTVWVREGSICHSVCVFILAAGDTRMIAGQVGIHRIIRMSSTATTRAELNRELHVVYQRVREYLERNGAAVAIADLMMAVPNRSLRLLSPEEIELYGLDGANAAQDDLDRLRLMRKCGEGFVARRDSFLRAFDRQCKKSHNELDDLNSCGVELRHDFGFPDGTCAGESPFSEFDLVAANEAAEQAADGNSDEAKPLEPKPSEANPSEPKQAEPANDGSGEAKSVEPPDRSEDRGNAASTEGQ
jgi:ATP-dependent protease ClpP protease subunit